MRGIQVNVCQGLQAEGGAGIVQWPVQPGGDLQVQLPDIGVGSHRDIRFIGKAFPGMGRKSEFLRGLEGK